MSAGARAKDLMIDHGKASAANLRKPLTPLIRKT